MTSSLFSYTSITSENESTLKGKNLLPLGASSSLSEWAPLQKGGKKKTILTELSPLNVYIFPLKGNATLNCIVL